MKKKHLKRLISGTILILVCFIILFTIICFVELCVKIPYLSIPILLLVIAYLIGYMKDKLGNI